MTDEADTPAVLNLWAVGGLVASVLVAVVGLFILPWMRDQGLAFRTAFVAVMVIEALAALGVAYSALNLYDEVF